MNINEVFNKDIEEGFAVDEIERGSIMRGIMRMVRGKVLLSLAVRFANKTKRSILVEESKLNNWRWEFKTFSPIFCGIGNTTKGLFCMS